MQFWKKIQSFHPEEGDLAAFADGELHWRGSLRLRLHLLLCSSCRRILTEIRDGLAVLPKSSDSTESLDVLKRNLIDAMRDYETRSILERRTSISSQSVEGLAALLGAAEAGKIAAELEQGAAGERAYRTVEDAIVLFLGRRTATEVRRKVVQEVND